jgi:hypothetical protein
MLIDNINTAFVWYLIHSALGQINIWCWPLILVYENLAKFMQ